MSTYIYGIDVDNQIWEIDPTNNYCELQYPRGNVAPPAIQFSVSAIAYDDGDSHLYLLPAGSGAIQYWHIANFQVNQVEIPGPTQQGQPPENAAFSGEKIWWFNPDSNELCEAAMNKTYNILTIVDTGSGTTTTYIRGPRKVHFTNLTSYAIQQMDLPTSAGLNTNTFGDIAISPDGILYGYTSRGRFYSIDLSNPKWTFNEISPAIADDNSYGLQLSFGVAGASDGNTLYAHRYSTGAWYTINLSNGSLTDLGYTTAVGSNGKGFRDLGGTAASVKASDKGTLLLF